jgi:hypothetical protein
VSPQVRKRSTRPGDTSSGGSSDTAIVDFMHLVLFEALIWCVVASALVLLARQIGLGQSRVSSITAETQRPTGAATPVGATPA